MSSKLRRLTDRCFQSHFGLISTFIFSEMQSSSKNLSIPFWSDFNPTTANFSRRSFILSIPFWSDFNPELGVVFTISRDSFQSHFGLISTFTQLSSINIMNSFNPILVWFQRFQHSQRTTNSKSNSDFQSHFGLISTTYLSSSFCYI